MDHPFFPEGDKEMVNGLFNCAYCKKITVILWINKFFVIATDPSFNSNEISNERWYITFQNGCISSNDVFRYNFCFVILIDNYNRYCSISKPGTPHKTNEESHPQNAEFEKTFRKRNLQWLPKFFWSILKLFPSPSSQPTTTTKSATNDGIEHFKTAAFPRMTYSLFTSVW